MKNKKKPKKIGRNSIKSKSRPDDFLYKPLTEENKKKIDEAVRRTVEEYGETLKLLAGNNN